MSKETLRRVQRLEMQAGTSREPLVIMIAPTHAPGHYWQCDAYVCQQTGWRCERDAEEAMPDFVSRAEQEAEAYADTSRSLLILLHPDGMQ